MTKTQAKQNNIKVLIKVYIIIVYNLDNYQILFNYRRSVEIINRNDEIKGQKQFFRK